MPLLDDRPLDDEGIDGWRVARVRCRHCGHEWISVFPAEADELSLECSRCHLQESEVIEDIPPEGEEEADAS
jgi:hypothetical protein